MSGQARLGSSTDDADAVILAWHQREQAIARRQPRPVPKIYRGPDSWML